MLALWQSVAQDPTALADPSLWTQFGPFAIVFVVMATLGGGIILWLLRDRAKREAEHTAALIAADERERALYDRIIANGEKFGPILDANTQAIERNTRALERAEARP